MLTWFTQKLDMLLGATVAALAGMASSQTQAFVQQYLQRLGGHLDEAQMRLEQVQTGIRYQVMNPDVRAEFERDALARVEELSRAFTAISEAGVFTRPVRLMTSGDPAIMARTWEAFVPAVPVDPASLFYVAVGLILGLIAYEIVRAPVAFVLARPRKRKFKRKPV